MTYTRRSKKETERLHRFTKPAPKKAVKDDLPPVDSHDEDEGSWSSGLEDSDLSLTGSDEEDVASESELSSPSRGHQSDSDAEMSYEAVPRKRRKNWEEEEDQGIERLPIKLANGRIQHSGVKFAPRVSEKKPEEESEESEDDATKLRNLEATSKVDDVSTGARFGRLAIVDVIGNKSRKARIQGAKEQIASISQEIVTDPENSVSSLSILGETSLT